MTKCVYRILGKEKPAKNLPLSTVVAYFFMAHEHQFSSSSVGGLAAGSAALSVRSSSAAGTKPRHSRATREAAECVYVSNLRHRSSNPAWATSLQCSVAKGDVNMNLNPMPSSTARTSCLPYRLTVWAAAGTRSNCALTFRDLPNSLEGSEGVMGLWCFRKKKCDTVVR